MKVLSLITVLLLSTGCGPGARRVCPDETKEEMIDFIHKCASKDGEIYGFCKNYALDLYCKWELAGEEVKRMEEEND